MRALVRAQKPRRLSLPSTKLVLLQALRGLGYCHSKGVLHRRVKLANLLYDPTVGVIKLAGFDCARRLPRFDGRSLTVVRGPWTGKSPEMLMHDAQDAPEPYSFPTDVWSAGCMLIELATGSAAFLPTQVTASARAT